MIRYPFYVFIVSVLLSCSPTRIPASGNLQKPDQLYDTGLVYRDCIRSNKGSVISRAEYMNKLQGFWLGECIGNWTGLVTEMDKTGNIGETKTGAFYTRKDWGKPDQPNIWSKDKPSELSPVIDFVFRNEGEVWGSDDDTDIEYMYQQLLYTNKTSILSPVQIRDGWLRHIRSEEENYLWVSNQAAFDLMKAGVLPPETSNPEKNPDYNMIDAQLTTEIFGLFAPSRPDIALRLAELPIRTTARNDAELIARFYVIMHSLASGNGENKRMKDRILSIADKARQSLPDTSTPAAMFDFIRGHYRNQTPWETTRDEVYNRYQVNQADGYDITSRNLYCNGCAAAGINFAASLISLFYGEGNIVETIKIGTLAGWDSDNPTATWGGLLGFMIGRDGVEIAFGRKFSSQFNIHRTRTNFPDNGIDNFENMARTGVFIIDRVVQDQMHGCVDLQKNIWYIPEEELNN